MIGSFSLQSLQHTPEIEFYYEDKAISFTVATLDYLGDDNVLFSYRLVDFEDQWSQQKKKQGDSLYQFKCGDLSA